MIIKLHNQIIYPIVFLLILAAVACTAPIKSNPIKIKRLIFLNKTPEALDDVRVYIHNTHEFVNCGYILPNSECSIGFRLREYQGNRFNISWEVKGQLERFENILVEVPDNLAPGKPVNAVIVFDRGGGFNARLQH